MHVCVCISLIHMVICHHDDVMFTLFHFEMKNHNYMDDVHQYYTIQYNAMQYAYNVCAFPVRLTTSHYHVGPCVRGAVSHSDVGL